MTSKSAITLALINFFFSLATGRNYRSLGRLNYKASTFRCPNEGFHADANDCRIFYRCVDWNSNIFLRDFSEPTLTAFQFSCVDGTVFDPDFNICNQPQETARRECGGRAMRDTMNDQYPFSYSSTVGRDDGNPYQESSYPSYPYYEVSTHNPDNYPNEYENQISPEVNPSESNAECAAEGFFPVPGDCSKFMRCIDDGMKGFRKFVFRCGPGTVWDQQNLVCNYPYAVPGCSGMHGEGQGYPATGGSQNENGQYPEQGFPEQQNNQPSQSGLTPPDYYPSTGEYPGQNQNQGNGVGQSGYPQGTNTGAGSYPNQGFLGQGNQPGYPGQVQNNINNPEQYPQQGNYPEHNGPVNEGSMPYPAGYPQQGSQGGYPGPVNRPPSGTYPNEQGYTPDQSGYPQQGQGGYPGPINRPSFGSNPGQQINGPNQSNNPQPTGYPDTYPNQNEIGQSSFPSEGYPQGGYPGTNTPNQGQGYPNHGTEEYGVGSTMPTGNPNECQSDGFFSVPGECMRFFRCVDNGKGGYVRHDFICGPGTVWDQESITCNHPWAVQRKDCSTSFTTEPTTDSSRSTSMQQQTTSNQNWSQSSSQTTSSFSNFTQSSSSSTSYFNSSSSSSSSSSTQSQTSSSANNQIVSSTDEGQSQSASNQEGFQSTQGQQTNAQNVNGMTTPMKPETRPTTMRPQQETTPAPGDVASSPPGSKPSQPDKNSPIKCERAGFYAVPGNCKKFYRCVDWDGDKGERFSVYYFECGEGTIWDPALETCNHEESVYPPRDCSSQPGTDNQSQPTTEESMNTTESIKDNDKSTIAPEEATEESTPNTESTTAEETDSPTQETSTNGKPTPTSESMGATSSSTDMTTTSSTDFNELTTPLPSESTPEQTSMTTENAAPTESTTEEETNPTSQEPDSSNERPNRTSAECPALGEGQVAFVCPTGFRRHPKDCNLFYQCTISKEGDVNVMTFSCKNDTVYDERKIQCLPQDETDPCPEKSGGRTRFSRKIEPEMTSVVPIFTSESLCPHEGHFPYQGDCKRFFKCQKDGEGKMQGYLYQCPEKYSFSELSSTCEKSSILPKCSRFYQYLTPVNLKWMTSKVPTEIPR